MNKFILPLIILLLELNLSFPQEFENFDCKFDKIVYTRAEKYERTEQNFVDFNNSIFANGGFLMRSTDLSWFFYRVIDALNPLGDKGYKWRVKNYYLTLKKILEFRRLNLHITDKNMFENIERYSDILSTILKTKGLEFSYKNVIDQTYILLVHFQRNDPLDIHVSSGNYKFLKWFFNKNSAKIKIFFHYKNSLTINNDTINKYIKEGNKIVFIINYILAIGDVIENFEDIYKDLSFFYENSSSPEIRDAIYSLLSTKDFVIGQIFENIRHISYDYFKSRITNSVIDEILITKIPAMIPFSLAIKVLNLTLDDNGEYFLYTYFSSELAKEFHKIVYNKQRDKILKEKIKLHNDLIDFARGNRFLFLTEAFTYHVMGKAFESMGQDFGLKDRIYEGLQNLDNLGPISDVIDFFHDFKRIMAYSSGTSKAYSENAYNQYRYISDFTNLQNLLFGFQITQNDVKNITKNKEFQSCYYSPLSLLDIKDLKDKNFYIFVIDVSGSMNDNNKLNQVKKVIPQLISSLPSKSNLYALIVYSGKYGCDRGKIVLPFTNDYQLILYAVNNLTAADSTPMMAGLQTAFEMSNQIPEGKKGQIFLLCDGQQNCPKGNIPALSHIIIKNYGIYGKLKIKNSTIDSLKQLTNLPDSIITKLSPLKGKTFSSKTEYDSLLTHILGNKDYKKYKTTIDMYMGLTDLPVTISTISVGKGVDEKTLKRMATQTSGKFFRAENPKQLKSEMRKMLLQSLSSKAKTISLFPYLAFILIIMLM